MTIAQSSTEQHIAAQSSAQQLTAAHSSSQQLTAAHSSRQAAHSSSQRHTAAHSSSQQLTAAHSSSQQLTAAHSSTQQLPAAHSSTQQHTACQPTCPTGLVTTAHRTRLDPVCARDSFGASPCALFRGRAGILRGSPCCLPRAIFTCIHICISHMYIYIHKHMYITRVYLHTYTYVYHTPKTPTTRIRVAQPSAALLFQHAGVCIDTHRKTCIGSRSFGKAFWGPRRRG
jgi:hypothetical protein